MKGVECLCPVTPGFALLLCCSIVALCSHRGGFCRTPGQAVLSWVQPGSSEKSRADLQTPQGAETAHASSFTAFDRNLTFLAWHVHKDGVSHQTPSFHCCQTKVCLWSLELGGCFKGLQLPGGWRGPAEHHCPEEKALSWADGSTVTAPHGVENSPPSHPLLQQALRGQSGQGGVRCGPAALGGWIEWRCRHVTAHTHTPTYTRLCIFARLLCEYGFYLRFYAPPPPTPHPTHKCFRSPVSHCLTSARVFASSSTIWLSLSVVLSA